MNPHLADVLAVWAVLLPGWLIGSIPIGWLIAMRKFGVNLLEHGSFGIGETNFVRSLIEEGVDEKIAKKWGRLVQFLDQLKGFGPIMLAMHLHRVGQYELNLTAPYIALIGMGLIMGHRYSAYLKLRGGKAVATTMGIAMALYWPYVWVPVTCYFVWFGLKKLLAKHTEQNTALASLIATSLMFLLSIFFIHESMYLMLLAYATIMIYGAHQDNIRTYRAEQKRKNRFPTDMPCSVFVTDPATSSPARIRELFAQKFSFAMKLPLWVFNSSLIHYIPFGLLRIGEEVFMGADGKYVRQYTWGWTWTTDQIKRHPKRALRHLLKLIRYLEKRGAMAFGLGASTAIVGDKGESIAKQAKVPVFNGNRLTGGLAAIVSLMVARLMGWGEPEDVVASVVGAGGNVGRATCHILLNKGVRQLLVVGRTLGSLADLVAELNEKYPSGSDCPRVKEVSLKEASQQSMAMVFATSSDKELVLELEDLQDGAILVDMARPRNVSKDLAKFLRILPNDGAMVSIRKCVGKAGLGLPAYVFFPCYSELVLALLEGWDFDWVDEPTLEQIEQVLAAFNKHGFEIAGLRMHEKPLTWEDVATRRKHADMIREARTRHQTKAEHKPEGQEAV